MKRSTDRILTSHTGSLPRPEDLLPLIFAKEADEPVDDRGSIPRWRRPCSRRCAGRSTPGWMF